MLLELPYDVFMFIFGYWAWVRREPFLSRWLDPFVTPLGSISSGYQYILGEDSLHLSFLASFVYAECKANIFRRNPPELKLSIYY